MVTESAPHLKFLTPLVLILLVIPSVCRSQNIYSQDTSQFTPQIEFFIEQFDNLESPLRFDKNLPLDMLSDFAESYMAQKDYDYAAQILERMLFIERGRSGLKSITILPILDKLTEIHFLKE